MYPYPHPFPAKLSLSCCVLETAYRTTRVAENLLPHNFPRTSYHGSTRLALLDTASIPIKPTSLYPDRPPSHPLRSARAVWCAYVYPWGGLLSPLSCKREQLYLKRLGAIISPSTHCTSRRQSFLHSKSLLPLVCSSPYSSPCCRRFAVRCCSQCCV